MSQYICSSLWSVLLMKWPTLRKESRSAFQLFMLWVSLRFMPSHPAIREGALTPTSWLQPISENLLQDVSTTISCPLIKPQKYCDRNWVRQRGSDCIWLFLGTIKEKSTTKWVYFTHHLQAATSNVVVRFTHRIKDAKRKLPVSKQAGMGKESREQK